MYEVVATPTEMRRDHAAQGGRNLRRFIARKFDGFVRVMLAEEPAFLNPPRGYEQHLSISFSDGSSQAPTRRPTDEEVAEALAEFPGGMEEDAQDAADPMIRQFWSRLVSG